MRKYSAGMMSVPFLFVETQTTAKLLAEGVTPAEAKRRVLEDNLYQMQSRYRSERYFNAISRRLQTLPKELLPDMAAGDVSQAKLLVLISIMRTDLLFFEFMYEVYRPALNIGNALLETKDINLFFDQKALQSIAVAAWSETTVSHLKSSYAKALAEAGLLADSREPRTITRVYMDSALTEQLQKAGMGNELACVLGDAYV